MLAWYAHWKLLRHSADESSPNPSIWFEYGTTPTVIPLDSPDCHFHNQRLPYSRLSSLFFRNSPHSSSISFRHCKTSLWKCALERKPHRGLDKAKRVMLEMFWKSYSFVHMKFSVISTLSVIPSIFSSWCSTPAHEQWSVEGLFCVSSNRVNWPWSR